MMVATPQALEALRFTAPQGVAGLEESYSAILERLGEDIEREGLLDTPKRAAKAMQFLTSGYTMTLDEVINGALFESDNDDMVTVRSIEFYSLCEHHLLPFFGRCHIAYLPRGKVLGLSKTARVVDYHARRLQIQENLTRQIAHTIDEVLEPRGVAVQMSAVHLCMMMRGVEKQTSDTSTSSFLGDFKTSSELRQEFNLQVSHSTGASSRF